MGHSFRTNVSERSWGYFQSGEVKHVFVVAALAWLVLAHVIESAGFAERARPDATLALAKRIRPPFRTIDPELLVAVTVVMASGTRLSSDSMHNDVGIKF
jgi:hypothetical protein